MPTYDLVSDEVIACWESMLSDMVDRLKDNISINSFCMFLIALYEYLQVSIGFRVRLRGVESVKVKISFEDVKKDVSSVEMRQNFQVLKNTADKLRHSYYNNTSVASGLLDTMISNETNISNIWKTYLSKVVKVKMFLLDRSTLQGAYQELFERSSLENECLKFAYSYLEIDGPSGTLGVHSVGETVDALIAQFRCSRSFATGVVCSVIRDHHCI